MAVYWEGCQVGTGSVRSRRAQIGTIVVMTEVLTS